jgi:ABC-type multidrug transport system permease subunit
MHDTSADRDAPQQHQREQRVSSPLVELTMARIKEFLREPEAVFWVFAFPVLMALALGVAFRSQKPADVNAGVLKQGSEPAAAAQASVIAKTLTDAGGIRVRVLSPPEADVALRNGVVAVLVVPPPIPASPSVPRDPDAKPGTAAMLLGVPITPYTYRYDPNRPESHLARMTVDAALQRASGRQDVLKTNDQPVATPGSRYIDWLLPGLLGMNIMGTGLWSIGFSVVMARTRKLLKRLMATPMPRGYYLLSHLLARLGFLVLEVIVLLLFGWLVFGVTSQGSIVLLSGLCLLGAFSFAGLGLLIASRAKTIEAVSGLMNVAMLPMWLLSGVFFSSANFPEVAQPFIQILPLTALIDGLRGVMIEGQSFAGIAHEIGILSAWGAGTFLLALKLFRWR